MVSHKFLSVVSNDIDILVVYGDDGSNKKLSEGVSTVPGQDRAGSIQETLANTSQCDNQGMEKSW